MRVGGRHLETEHTLNQDGLRTSWPQPGASGWTNTAARRSRTASESRAGREHRRQPPVEGRASDQLEPAAAMVAAHVFGEEQSPLAAHAALSVSAPSERSAETMPAVSEPRQGDARRPSAGHGMLCGLLHPNGDGDSVAGWQPLGATRELPRRRQDFPRAEAPTSARGPMCLTLMGNSSSFHDEGPVAAGQGVSPRTSDPGQNGRQVARQVERRQLGTRGIATELIGGYGAAQLLRCAGASSIGRTIGAEGRRSGPSSV